VSEPVLRAAGEVLGHGAAFALGARARAEILGAGPLQALLEAPDVTDVLVNGGAGVWVDKGRGLELWSELRLEEGSTRALAVRLAAACGQRLDDASPVVDGRLPDGTRLHAVLPPLCVEGTAISLRTLRRRALTVEELVSGAVVGPEGAELLRALVDSRANVIVSGATGVGKTTLLSAMLSLVPAHERIVCIEEAPELNPEHPHVLHLQVRRANVEGVGEIGLDQLVRAALRMRPDRLVLGECRGAEVRDVLGALNTGHDGGWATVHANTASDVPARLTALGALARMDAPSVAAQAVSGLDAVLHLRKRGPVRWLAEVAVLDRDSAGRLVAVPAAAFGREGDLSSGPGWDRLARRLEVGVRR
jgi:pilus assembly protein CpaF